jgi:hypothetical protein
MPDREVTCIRDIIYYQYAKIIAKSAFHFNNGREAKKEEYGFIKERFRGLKDERISWADILREDWQQVETQRECIYCGSTENIQREHLVPQSLRICNRCSSCDHIQAIHNQVWACKNCNDTKGTKGLYEFYKFKLPEIRDFYDFIPPLAEKKYLKTMMCCHMCANTLDCKDLDGDGKITVLDIDYILHNHPQEIYSNSNFNAII